MASIPKAFHSFSKKEMTVSEYDAYLKEHQYRTSICAIKCVECGDILTFCKGTHNVPYFKHSPTHEGHSYCSLYNEGKESRTNESLIRKKFFREEDITLNYELIYKSGKRKSFITIPPFKEREILENERNETKIRIANKNSVLEIPIDRGHFLRGEVKKIGLSNFSPIVYIRICGNSTNQNISYEMNGFVPNNQIYSNLIVQNYISSSSTGNIDLRKISSFICKRISGYIYTGRHYIVFSKSPNFHLEYNNSKSIEVKCINFIRDNNFDYYAFDIVFNCVDQLSKEFCITRNCELLEKDDAVILWPPVKAVGNYHYYENIKTSMFILYENDSKALEMERQELFSERNGEIKLFFRVENPNSNYYYVTLDQRKVNSREAVKFETLNIEEVDVQKFNLIYVLNKDIVLKKIDYESKINKSFLLLLMNSQLDRTFTKIKSDKTKDNNLLLNAIRYTREYMNLDVKYLDYIEEKYSDDEFVMSYIEHCKSSKTIKKKALEILLGEFK